MDHTYMIQNFDPKIVEMILKDNSYYNIDHKSLMMKIFCNF